MGRSIKGSISPCTLAITVLLGAITTGRTSLCQDAFRCGSNDPSRMLCAECSTKRARAHWSQVYWHSTFTFPHTDWTLHSCPVLLRYCIVHLQAWSLYPSACHKDCNIQSKRFQLGSRPLQCCSIGLLPQLQHRNFNHCKVGMGQLL